MDIEGTVAPIEFVHQKMFPYVRDNVKEYLQKTWTTSQTQDDIGLLIAQSQSDSEAGDVTGVTLITMTIDGDRDQLLAQVVDNVTSQMDIDRKIGALKTLQGHIWAEAFGSGALVAELYDDVYVALDLWSSSTSDGDAKKELAIYSSGSVGAQKLLFSHTKNGDLTGLFSGFYDTAVGFKREKRSYENILVEIGMEGRDKAQQCLFLTDIYEEAVAADEAGMQTALVIRPGNYPLPDAAERFKKIQSFAELQ